MYSLNIKAMNIASSTKKVRKAKKSNDSDTRLKATAKEFTERLKAMQSQAELEKIQRYFKYGDGDIFIGVRMGSLFKLSEEFIEMEPS